MVGHLLGALSQLSLFRGTLGQLAVNAREINKLAWDSEVGQPKTLFLETGFLGKCPTKVGVYPWDSGTPRLFRLKRHLLFHEIGFPFSQRLP